MHLRGNFRTTNRTTINRKTEDNIVNIRDAYPSKYLTATDLPEEGPQSVTIEKIGLEEVGRDKEIKPVIYFEEFGKSLICNKTNARSIARALGSEEFDDWVGRRIALYRAEVEFAGEMVEAIRVKPIRTPATARQIPKKPVPAAAVAPAAAEEDPNEDDSIPF
jgi:hypothetical protein